MANIERLKQLEEHLRNGKLGHKNFNFRHFNKFGNIPIENNTPYTCGTDGCAIGECPFAFPEDCVFSINGLPVIVKYKEDNNYGEYVFISIKEYFDLESKEANHLFFSNAQRKDLFGGKNLYGDSTKEEVADNIQAFITHRGLLKIYHEIVKF